MDSPDPVFLDDLGDEEMRAALAARDIGAVYRRLRRLGVSQRGIAQRTGQSQSEVSEILRGRQVQNVWVLERIADGLSIPRAWMGLSYGEQEPGSSPAPQEVDPKVKRRILIAAALGQTVLGLGGEPITLALPTEEEPLPSRLSMSHIHTIRGVTEGLCSVGRYYGGQAGLFRDAVKRYTRWMHASAPEAVEAALATALAELHTEAGWACYDSGLDATGYFTRALELGHQAGDSYAITKAAWTAGATLVRDGRPNDALALFQLGGFTARKPTQAARRADDPRFPTLLAWLDLNSATAYALMSGPDEATRYLAEAHDGWEPRDAFEHGGMDRATAGIYLDLGQLDTAEQFATSAVRSYGEGHRRGRTLAALLLAEVHIRAGEPQGLSLAHQAIEGVSTLHSIAARRERLLPLAAALDARPGTEAQELARMARQIATTRI